ncbi:type VII secretion integral membrane protein EccD [Actinomadura craniellae]|uniref:Type VII secretion integral membrane protein EccD n=1 Tax=Actinomadura craniellae TaxID=2231787 RepID=A0A365H2C5_9ACTN|nr:EsaB/YukD family protein [Actinomadura craniellae]RAY13176.1 type VII secretion integral membrane protein EccD [Actinomadura craniellae]
MAAWSRVTLVGEQRRVDVVLPAREPVGALMPDVLQLLGDPVQQPPRLRHLATATGEVLDGDSTLADRGIADGAVLRLVRSDEPLPAPVVHEVPEAVGDALDGRAWRWGPGAARWSATGTLVVLLAAMGVLVRSGLPHAGGLAAVGAAAALLLIAGPALGILGREPLGTALTLGGGALAGLALWFAGDLYEWPGWTGWAGPALVAGLLVTGLGATSPLGRGGLIGGVLTLVLALAAALCAAFGLAAEHTAAVLALTCVVLLSLLLRTALTLSGLTSLDDRRSTGATVARGDVLSALAGAHHSMVIATVAVAVAAAAAGVAATERFGGWTAALSALLALVVAGRARMFPLVLEKAALFAAALLIVVRVAWAWAEHASWALGPALAVLLAGLVIPVVVLATEQPEHVRARLRRIMNRIEAMAVVAIVPVAIGTFGVFERLLGTF